MKKILGSIALFVIVSCGTDNNSGITINEANIMGRWYIKGQTVNGANFQNHTDACPENKDYQDILAGYNATTVAYDSNCGMSKNQQATWTLSGTTFTLLYFDPAITGNYTYTVEGLSEHEMLLKKSYTQEGQSFSVLTNWYRD